MRIMRTTCTNRSSTTAASADTSKDAYTSGACTHKPFCILGAPFCSELRPPRRYSLLGAHLYIARPTLAYQTRERTRRTQTCLLYTSDAADERSSVDLGGR